MTSAVPGSRRTLFRIGIGNAAGGFGAEVCATVEPFSDTSPSWKITAAGPIRGRCALRATDSALPSWPARCARGS